MKELSLSELQAARQGDREAAGRLLEENSGLIWSVARRYFGRGVEAEDLYQLGCLGFLKAIEGFDEAFGTRFSTYAVPKIAGEIRRFLRDDGMLKVSRSVKEQAAKIHQARLALEQRLGREPSVSELGEATGYSGEEIAFAQLATGPAESIHSPCGEDGFSLELVLGDFEAEERMLERVSLRSLVEQLPERERKVIALRYYHGLTQQSCARVLGVSQVQVSRLERRAVDALRLKME
ncbi:MAG: sigma-70 family RNA polymerase sigma factor [Oscillospiraceae bacterium]|nr:sigma-70 family RNA polymerase sigma factor [Oscillospiraceae bacterium]